MRAMPCCYLKLPLQESLLCIRFEEGLDKHAYGGAKGYAKETARCKALDVAERLKQSGDLPALIIGADTVMPIS